jgi:uncharacterized membrane protein YgcG
MGEMRIVIAFGAVLGLVLAFAGDTASAQEGWVIESFDVEYDIQRTGEVLVTEDIRVDFGTLERHGIFRDMPVRYHYDDDHDRLIAVGDVSVDDGSSPHQFELIASDANLRIKIGDPDVFVTGQQRYRIQYTLLDALNPNPLNEAGVPQPWDEFFWNVTGNDWEATILKASAVVNLPSSAIEQVTCYQGPTGSQDPCASAENGDSANFQATTWLGPGSGLTLVTAIQKGAVEVGPPVLVEPLKSDWDRFTDAWNFGPLALAATALISIIAVIALARLWWMEGRDRWYGDMHHLVDGSELRSDGRKPLFAHETIVVEYEPPAVERRGRPLRPAEIGLLVDETADTLDVTATIVDLAVRGHLTITEEKSGGVFGLFQKTDYTLDELPGNEDDLLTYESKLKTALFKGGKSSVKLSELKNKFHEDLERVKKSLYTQAVQDKFFPRSPDSTRTLYQIAGVVAVLIGVAIGVALGLGFGGALLGIPIVIAGVLLFLLAPSFPHRTALGRLLMRRSLGFRKFMVTAETERQRFAERQNIFHEYLPYAIVFGCVDKWAKAFEDLGLMPEQPHWYRGTGVFVPVHFAGTMHTFSSSVSGTIASTPGGSGGSGFGGGGGSGGGGGGGGGGSW